MSNLKSILPIILILLVPYSASSRQGMGQPVIPDCLGVNMPRKIFNETDVEMLAVTGFKFIRTDICWMDVEREKGVYSYDRPPVDDWVQMCARRDLKLMFIFDYGHSMYGPVRAVNSEEGRRAFAAFAEATAARYAGHGILWEIWNEPNAPVFWKPEPNVDDYIALVKEVAPLVKAADTSGLVVAPAVSYMDFNFLEGCFKRDLLEYVDILSVHPYRSSPPETVIDDYQKLRDMIKEYAPKNKRIPIISGEWGYSLIQFDKKSRISVMQQAQCMIRMFLVNMYREIPLSIWHNWINIGYNAHDREHNFGLVTRDRSPKPAFTAATVMIRTLSGFHVEERIDTGRDDDFVLRLRRDDGAEAIAFWSSGDEREVVLPINGGRGKIVEMLGDEKPISWESGALDVKLSPSPQYLVLEK